MKGKWGRIGGKKSFSEDFLWFEVSSPNSSQTRSTLLNLFHLLDNMSFYNVKPTDNHFGDLEPGAKLEYLTYTILTIQFFFY